MEESQPVEATRQPVDPKLRLANENLHIALEAGRLGAWEWDIAHGRVHWSPTLEQIHGLEPGTFSGTFEAYTSDMHPEDKDRVLASIQEALREGRPHLIEYRIIRPDGAIRWLEARGKVLLDDDGNPERMIGVCMDVSLRKSDEIVLQQLTHEARRVGEFRERLLGIVAHDLRNPLSAISMGAQILREADSLPADLQKTVGRITRSVERMNGMISQLLDFAQGRLGDGVSVTLAPIDMREVARRIVEECEIANPKRKVQFEATGDLRGQWDGDRVAQVIANLVANAIMHGEGSVRVALADVSDAVELTVTNQGTPIPPESFATLFEPFRRASTRTEGLGLGLYIVSEIVRAHRGTLDVKSTAGDGTTFTVRWPKGA